MESLASNAALSLGAAALSGRLIPEFFPIFLRRNLFGVDRCKKNPTKVFAFSAGFTKLQIIRNYEGPGVIGVIAPNDPRPVNGKIERALDLSQGEELVRIKKANGLKPEPMGVVIATVYLIVMFLFIPIPFYGWLTKTEEEAEFPYHYFVEFLSGLMAICCMILLGFADDIFDLRWRHKLMLPSLASLPLLMVYAANCNSTTILLPKQLTAITGLSDVNIGLFYYVYMGMLAVFCTNAINILAGVNGLEAGQSLIIAASIILYNAVQLWREDSQAWQMLLSIYYLLPYIATTAVLFAYNWYPAQVFVGDTFCYWSGMTLAVAGIQGRFSKTLLLFFIPQIFNFVFSVPQLFHLIPCPRHRMPRYDPETDKVEASWSEFKSADLRPAGRLILAVCSTLGLVQVAEEERDGESWLRVTNFTLIVLILKVLGPMHEQRLATVLLFLQFLGSCLAFFIRFWMAAFFYAVVR